MNPILNEKTLPQLQKRHWHLLIIVCVIVITLSIYVVLDTIRTNPEDWAKRSYYLKVYIIGFSVLITLFTTYILQETLVVQRMARKLFKEMKRKERIKAASEFSKITTRQLQESLEVIRLATQYFKSKLDKEEDMKHLDHIEEELTRADNLVNYILTLPELISKEEVKEDA